LDGKKLSEVKNDGYKFNEQLDVEWEGGGIYQQHIFKQVASFRFEGMLTRIIQMMNP